MKRLLALSSILLVSLFAPNVISAQKSDFHTSCDAASGILDALATQDFEDEDVIQVVSYLGKNEMDTSLHERRLHNVKTYLVDFKRYKYFFDHPDNVILSIGLKTFDRGRIEIYSKGRKFVTFTPAQNRDLFVGNCVVDLEEDVDLCDLEGERLLYPCKDKFPKVNL